MQTQRQTNRLFVFSGGLFFDTLLLNVAKRSANRVLFWMRNGPNLLMNKKPKQPIRRHVSSPQAEKGERETTSSDSTNQQNEATSPEEEATWAPLVSTQDVASPQHTDSRGSLLLMLFVILGPLALRRLWRSEHFSLLEKIVLTFLTIALFLFTLWLVYYLVKAFLLPQFQALIKELKLLQGLM